jgi:creatinine amidohydrolase
MSNLSDWAHSTAPELRERWSGAIGLWAVGATEQHGPHLVTGFDHLVAEEVVRRVATELGAACLVLPTLPVGCSEHWLGFGATLSLTPATMIAVLGDVVRSAAQAGLRHLVIVNGHAGNSGVGVTAVGGLFDSVCAVEFVSYWDLITNECMRTLLTKDNAVGHAGEFETAIGLAMDGLVRSQEIPQFGRAYRRPTDRRGTQAAVRVDPAASNGVVGDPTGTDGEVGRRLLDSACEGLLEHCRGLLALDGDA